MTGVNGISHLGTPRHLYARVPDANDPGLLMPAQTSLLTDQYELAMASSYYPGRQMGYAA